MKEPAHGQKATEMQGRLAELSAKFLVRSTADLATMRSQLGRLAAGEAGALDEIRHLAHRMVGTGATLGFEAVSEHACRVERLAESGPAGARPGEALGTQLADAVATLEAELQRLHSR